MTAIEALYDANLTYSDSIVGTILAQLDAAGIGDDALVIVTSDHGEAFWQHGEQGHNTTLYDEMLHVPLIVRFPKGKGPAPGARPSGLVTPMDLVPSVCDWLDLPLPASDLVGRSLTPALFGEPDLARALRLRSHHPDAWYGLRTLTTKTLVVRGAGGEPSHVEHYLLDTDPGEQHDALAEHRAAADLDVETLKTYAIASARNRVLRGLKISDSEREMLKGLSTSTRSS